MLLRLGRTCSDLHAQHCSIAVTAKTGPPHNPVPNVSAHATCWGLQHYRLPSFWINGGETNLRNQSMAKPMGKTVQQTMVDMNGVMLTRTAYKSSGKLEHSRHGSLRGFTLIAERAAFTAKPLPKPCQTTNGLIRTPAYSRFLNIGRPQTPFRGDLSTSCAVSTI